MAAPRGASAQTTPQNIPNDSAVEVNLFEPALGPHSFLTVSGADLLGDRQFSVGFTVDYMTHPFTVYTVDKMDNLSTRTDVVKSLFAGELGAAYGIKDRFQFGVAMPFVFSLTGDGLDPATGDPTRSGISVSGFGDVHLELAMRVWQKQNLTLTVIPVLTLPTSTSVAGENAYLGDQLPSFRPRAALEWTDPGGRFTVGGNVGFGFRKPRTIYSSTVGQQVTYGAAAAYHATSKVDVVAELFGRNGFTAALDASPLEADGALRVMLTPYYSIVVGAGTGVISGLGAPGLRVFAAVSWTPDYRDSDHDGIDNMHDKCPFQAEDKDGYQDADGCPDPDNDGDKIPDKEDKCPNQPEDLDGFQDEDGCPDPDNDHDGIPDEKDRCPNDAEDHLPPHPDDGCPASMTDSDDDGIPDSVDKCPDEPEDKDGFQDADGCPDLDNDNDGVPDEYDQCPNEPEDMDGFQDADGCPDPDNDQDGFLDSEDKCPNEPETVNGFQDADGCPDKGGKTLASFEGGKLVLVDPVTWTPADALSTQGKAELSQAALVMRAQGHVKKWRVVVAAEAHSTEAKTRAASQKRADAIKALLVSKGVKEDRIEAIGAVSDNPIVVIVATERDDAPKADAPPADSGAGGGGGDSGAPPPEPPK